MKGGEKMTATELIYKAWRNTPKPIIYHTADAKGNPIEVDCDFLDPTADFKQCEGQCSICGADITEGIPNKKMFSSNYTDWHLHKNPSGTHVCKACAFTMILNVNKGRMALLRYSFCASDTLKICNRTDLRDILINPPEPPFVMVCAVSQKKHLAIKSKISYSKENYLCMLEEECIQVNRGALSDMIKACEALRGIGFTKDEIAQGIVRYDKVKQFSPNCFDTINKLLKPMRALRMFALALHVSQKMNEEEAICYLDLKPRTAMSPQEHCSSTQHTKAEMSKEDRQAMTCGRKSSDSLNGPQSEQLMFPNF